MWLAKLKAAIVQNDAELIDKLLDEVPSFDDVEDARVAMYLLEEAFIFLNTLRDETSENMKQIEKSISFIKSTRPQSDFKLNIKS